MGLVSIFYGCNASVLVKLVTEVVVFPACILITLSEIGRPKLCRFISGDSVLFY